MRLVDVMLVSDGWLFAPPEQEQGACHSSALGSKALNRRSILAAMPAAGMSACAVARAALLVA
jgi:hypothetical protein